MEQPQIQHISSMAQEVQEEDGNSLETILVLAHQTEVQELSYAIGYQLG